MLGWLVNAPSESGATYTAADVLRRSATVVGAWTVAVALLLTFWLAVVNRGTLPLSSLPSLFLATLWISMLLHALFLAVLLVCSLVFRRLLAISSPAEWTRWLCFGFLALHVGWSLWARLVMVHQWASVRPFITWTGIAQSLVLVALMVVLLVAGVHRRPRSSLALRGALFALAAVLATALLAWNRHGESRVRSYDLEPLRRSLSSAPANDSERSEPEARRQVIVLGIDGMSWNIAGPLIKAGRLPHLAQLLRGGASGYLDNGVESYSPRIWNTIFSGRPAKEHGIHSSQKVKLLGSSSFIDELPPARPSIHAIYGLDFLFGRLPSLGLWRMTQTGSADRRVKAIWDVASEYGRKVVVVNGWSTVPAYEVNGAMVNLRSSKSSVMAYPRALEQERSWPPLAFGKGTKEWEVDLARRFHQEVDYAIELFTRYSAELGIYYTHVADSLAHSNWDFYARDRFLLTGLPSALDESGWDAMVLAHREEPPFRIYDDLDQAIGRFRQAFPEAILVICSDHGWTFSGYEHFNSPEGVIVIAGEGTAAGVPLSPASISDVTPTLLAMLGVPISKELAGSPLVSAFSPKPRLFSVEAYGALEHGLAAAEVEDEEELERLRALGYVN